MGFEQKVAPVPERKDQLKMIAQLEESWLNQSYLKYYMHEDLRRPKMAFANRINQVKGEFWLNFFVGTLLFAPIAIMSKRLILTRSRDIPRIFPNSKYVDRAVNTFENRRNQHNVLAGFTWIGLSTLAAYLLTNWEPLEDQNYSFSTKTHKML